MTIGELKKRIEYLDDELDVVVSAVGLFQPIYMTEQADIQLPFHPPVEVGPDRYEMRLVEPLKPQFLITYNTEENND